MRVSYEWLKSMVDLPDLRMLVTGDTRFLRQF